MNPIIQEYFKDKDIEQWILKYINIEKIILESKSSITFDQFQSYVSQQTEITKGYVSSLKEAIDSNTSRLERVLGTSATKGSIVEKNFYTQLLTEFPTLAIEYSAKQTHKGDIFIHSDLDYPNILIDTKNYACNVPTTEVNKFKENCKSQNSCGILISIHTGIAKKPDLSVEIINNTILVYISHNGNDIAKIKNAIQIIKDLYKIEFPHTNSLVLEPAEIERLKKQIKSIEDNKKDLIEHLEQALATAKKIKIEQLFPRII